MNYFEYVNKDFCACGEALEPSGNKIYKHHEWGDISFIKCYLCGSWNQSPQISTDSLSRWYNSDEYQLAANTDSNEGIYLNYLAGERQRQREAASRYKRDLSGYKNSNYKNVLEVGCATGTLLGMMHKRGWEVKGIDLSERFVEAGREINQIDIDAGNFLDFDFSSDPFDVLIMLGTISNLQNVRIHMKHVADNLKQKGIFYFNFPDAESWIARVYGKNYWMFTPTVSTFFTKKGVKSILTDVGFVDIQFKMDYQSPSLSKLIALTKLNRFYNAVSRSDIINAGLPISFPVPGVYSVIAKLG